MSLTLVTFKKSGTRKNIKLREGETLIGRRPECNVRIPRIEVSRNHCRIVNRNNQATIQDLGSSNGTYLNSEKIMEAVIQAGDIISVGHTLFTVQIDGKPEAVTPPEPEQHEHTAAPTSPEEQTQLAASSAKNTPDNDPLIQPDPFDDSFADIADMLMQDDDEDEDLADFEK